MRQANLNEANLREADPILERFPGPVTLHISARKKLLALALGSGLLVFSIYLLVAPGIISGTYETIMACLSVLLFGGLTVRAVIMLLARSAARLTLDADGFEVSTVFWHVPTPWRTVRGFRVEETGDDKVKRIVYDVLTAGGERAQETGTLLDNYGLPDGDLARLMNEWRRRALS